MNERLPVKVETVKQIVINWKLERNRDRRDIKSKLGYSRIGLGNI